MYGIFLNDCADHIPSSAVETFDDEHAAEVALVANYDEDAHHVAECDDEDGDDDADEDDTGPFEEAGGEGGESGGD